MGVYSTSQTPERDFILKLSALEIYNETVVDLLNRESGSLRLLDDPEVLRINSSTEGVLDGTFGIFVFYISFRNAERDNCGKTS